MEVPVTITVTAEAVGTTVTAMVGVAVMGTAMTTVMVIHTATEAARTLAGVKLCRLDVFFSVVTIRSTRFTTMKQHIAHPLVVGEVILSNLSLKPCHN